MQLTVSLRADIMWGLMLNDDFMDWYNVMADLPLRRARAFDAVADHAAAAISPRVRTGRRGCMAACGLELGVTRRRGRWRWRWR